jgi:hypothetical protein
MFERGMKGEAGSVFEGIERNKKLMLKYVTVATAEILYGAVFHRFIVIGTVKSI